MWSGADASYLAAITAAGRKYTWHGTLTDANGSTYNFDAEDIVKGSGQISKMVSSDTSLDIGTVYTSELTIRLYLAVNRYVLFGGTIDLYCDVDVNGATYSVPMGEYIIASCTQEMACISITAYDAMTKLDSVNVVQDLGASTPYAWITYFLSRAGLTLGTAQATIEAMPNGTELLTFTNCNTELAAMPCRDALAYMCMILCANAYVGRDGKVYIQQYSMTADDDIAANERFSSSFSDFTTNYTSVTLGIHATGTTEYYAQPTDDGLNYDLGANPWLQAGSAAERETMCRAILADLNGVSYEPYTVSIPIRPELDPMDVLTFSGNQASTDKGAVTSVVYKLGGAMTIKCSGENPRLAGAKSKTQKSLAALTSTVAKEINQMSVVQNSSAVTCGENTETSILTYNFEVTQEENTTMVDVSVVMTSSASETEANDVYTLSDIVAHLSFYVDGSEVSVYSPEFIVDEGKDTMTFNFSLSGLSVGAHEFDIRLTVDGGSGSIAVGDVHEIMWGYGITFEVYAKSIEVAEPPYRSVFYVGQSLDYAGLRIDRIYNNGIREDVTADCELDPADGTAVTEYDLGTMTVYANCDGFSTDFDLTVREMAYEIMEGSYSYKAANQGCPPQTVIIGNNAFIFSFYVSSNGGPVYIYIAKFTVSSSGYPTFVRRATHMESKTDSGIKLWFRCGCRIGEYWYSFFSSIFDAGPYTIFREGISSSYEMTISFVYRPDTSKPVTFYSLEDKVLYSVNGYMIFPAITTTVDGTVTTSLAWGVINGTAVTIYVENSSSIDDDIRYHYISTSDGIYGATSGGTPRNIFDTNLFYNLSNGVLTIYQLYCDENGPRKEQIASIQTNLAYLSTGNCRRIIDSTTLLFADYSTTPYLCGVYDLVTQEYKEFSFEISNTDEKYRTVSNMGQIVWSNHFECYFLPQIGGSNHYVLRRSFDLENWEVVEEYVDNTDTIYRIGNLMEYSGSLFGAWVKESTEGGVLYDTGYAIGLKFTDTE